MNDEFYIVDEDSVGPASWYPHNIIVCIPNCKTIALKLAGGLEMMANVPPYWWFGGVSFGSLDRRLEMYRFVIMVWDDE